MMRWVILAALLMAAPGWADQSGVLAPCTTEGVPCVATVTSDLACVTLAVHKVSGTMAINIECQVKDGGDAWHAVASTLTGDTIIPQLQFSCYALRVAPVTCTGPCVYTVTYRGQLASK